MPIQIHLFLGYPQEEELAFHLSKNPHWKEGELALRETSWQNQNYVGVFLSPLLSCPEIKEKSKQIKNQVQLCCPKINLDLFSIYLFPQILLF